MAKRVEVEFYDSERPTIVWTDITTIRDEQYKISIYSETGLVAILHKEDIKNLIVDGD